MDAGAAVADGPAAELTARLAAQGTAERAAGERRYLKSPLTHLGVGMPALRRTTRAFLREQRPDLAERLALAAGLWARPEYEARRAAVEVLARSARELDATHLVTVGDMLRAATTWALVDPLAIDVAGVVAQHDPRAGATIDRWIGADTFWLRRAALLAHLPALRADPATAFDGFAARADRVLDEREFFVRKAIGWALREVARRAPDLVVAWLEPRTARASGVTMREAVRYLPEADAARLMAAYRARR